jgi:hypothetical protein
MAPSGVLLAATPQELVWQDMLVERFQDKDRLQSQL